MNLGRSVLAVGLFWACSSAEHTGDQFVAAYFADASQVRALELSTGVATQKLQEELRLVTQVRVSGYGPAQARAGEITWRRLRSRADEDRVRIEYELVIRTDGTESPRRALVSLRKEDVGWKVSNYQLLEAPPKPLNAP